MNDFTEIATINQWDNLPGWCCKEKRAWLIDTIKNYHHIKFVCEIGVFGGSSLFPMAFTLQEKGGYIVGIDPWEPDSSTEGMLNPENIQYWRDMDYSSIYEGVKKYVEKYKLTSCVELVRKQSQDVAQNFKDNSIDILHIDGNHSAEPAMRDARLYLPKVRTGGIIVFDDYEWTEGGISTVKPAVEWACANGCTLEKVDFGCAILRRYK